MTVGELIIELKKHIDHECYIDGKHETLDRMSVNDYWEEGRVFITPDDNSIDNVYALVDELSKCDKDAPVFLFGEFWDNPEEFEISIETFDYFGCGCFLPCGCSCEDCNVEHCDEYDEENPKEPEYSFEAVIFKEKGAKNA